MYTCMHLAEILSCYMHLAETLSSKASTVMYAVEFSIVCSWQVMCCVVA